MTKYKNGQLVTKCICHKGFSGFFSVVARPSFRVGGWDTTPQSLTAHTLNRYIPSLSFNPHSIDIKKVNQKKSPGLFRCRGIWLGLVR